MCIVIVENASQWLIQAAAVFRSFRLIDSSCMHICQVLLKKIESHPMRSMSNCDICIKDSLMVVSIQWKYLYDEHLIFNYNIKMKNLNISKYEKSIYRCQKFAYPRGDPLLEQTGWTCIQLKCSSKSLYTYDPLHDDR